MGRKPISDGRKHNQLRIMLTESERLELDAAADDLPTSTWARDLLLTAARAKNAAKKKRTSN